MPYCQEQLKVTSSDRLQSVPGAPPASPVRVGQGDQKGTNIHHGYVSSWNSANYGAFSLSTVSDAMGVASGKPVPSANLGRAQAGSPKKPASSPHAPSASSLARSW